MSFSRILPGQFLRSLVESPPEQAVLLHIRYVMESICEWMSFTDVTIVTGTERLRAHRAILASHSSYLRQLMTANVRDAGVEEDPTIVVRDVSSAHLRLMMQGHDSIGKKFGLMVQKSLKKMPS